MYIKLTKHTATSSLAINHLFFVYTACWAVLVFTVNFGFRAEPLSAEAFLYLVYVFRLLSRPMSWHWSLVLIWA